MATDDRAAAIMQLVYLVGVFAVVILQDPTLRAEAVLIAKRFRAALIGPTQDDEPAPAEVSAVIASAERILQEGEV
jgi:hypothetical protein